MRRGVNILFEALAASGGRTALTPAISNAAAESAVTAVTTKESRASFPRSCDKPISSFNHTPTQPLCLLAGVAASSRNTRC
jgi:hypothetical protein